MKTETNDFSVVLPVRDTDEEVSFFPWSFSSCLHLHPSEVLLCLDKPASRKIIDIAHRIARSFKFDGLKILEVEKTSDWKFPLAKITWNAYKAAKNDVILHYDVDTVLYPTVLKGLSYVGKNNIAVVSFSKFLQINSLPSLIRASWYHFRRITSENVFAGLYYIYRPYYFDLVTEDKLKSIYNGIDVVLVDVMEKQNKYKILTMRDLGCYCLTPQNEDYPWRQFQEGLWLSANNLWGENEEYSKPPIWLSIFAKSFFYARPHIIKGYLLGKSNPDLQAVRAAKGVPLYDYVLTGGKYVRGYGKGTGMVD